MPLSRRGGDVALRGYAWERRECGINDRALRSDTGATAAQPLVDLSALWEMYSAAVTLSIVYSQEVYGTEEKVGGLRMMCSGIENKLEKNLSIVGCRLNSN
jgi:hypothetical protein